MIRIIDRHGKAPKLPSESQLTRWFWQGLGDGLFQSTRCRECDRISFPPRPDCPNCLASNMEWTSLTRRGTIYTTTLIRAVPTPFIESAPLPVGVIDLEDGVRLLCWLVEGAGRLPLDSTVEIVTLRYEDGCLFGAAPIAMVPLL
ncbi:MAG: Zn-ribbon domain-containing OB-fold protein [Alphaproteobacteria bacterium]|nr:MAG: Zn-ribbon domain-containing OB-fold protein [Alphaproteobacteria bacterium]